MRVYSAPVLAQVTLIKHVLEMHGIECHIQGEYRSGAAGELPPTEAWPELWVVDPLNLEEAKRLVDEALEPAGPVQSGWTCPSCKEVNESQFGQCWNCGASYPAGPQE